MPEGDRHGRSPSGAVRDPHTGATGFRETGRGDGAFRVPRQSAVALLVGWPPRGAELDREGVCVCGDVAPELVQSSAEA